MCKTSRIYNSKQGMTRFVFFIPRRYGGDGSAGSSVLSNEYELKAKQMLNEFDQVATRAQKEGDGLQFQGILLPEELLDLRRNVRLLREQIVNEIRDTTKAGVKSMWGVQSWQKASSGLRNIVDVRIKLVEDFLSAFRSDLCLPEKQKRCSDLSVNACTVPCLVSRKPGILSRLTGDQVCTYPTDKAKQLSKYSEYPNHSLQRCPYQPSK